VKLYGYYRSSAAYRVRIALNLKGLSVEHAFVHLRRKEQLAAAWLQLNPAGLVPALEHQGLLHTQSLAIIEYLEEIQPQPALLPPAPADRSFVRAVALSVACDIHPLNNLRVLNYLRDELGVADGARDRWYAHWTAAGLAALEQQLSRDSRVGKHCLGDQPGLADVCLVPQFYNAERMKCDVTGYPTLRRLVAAARALPAFAAAAPERQPDSE
jgi:maleylpyruvate isomerase